MCARFENLLPLDRLFARHGAVPPPGHAPAPEFRPDDAVLIVTREGALLARWGLRVDWDSKLLINARAETLAARPTFRRLLTRRCLVPATAWFDWQAVAGSRTKRRHRLRPSAVDSFAFAGLCDGDRVVVITTAPAPAAAAIHDRMPAVLAEDDEARWLDPDLPPAEALALLRPFPGPLSVEAQPATSPAARAPRQGSLFESEA